MNELESKHYHWKFPYILIGFGILFTIIGYQLTNSDEMFVFIIGLGMLSIGIAYLCIGILFCIAFKEAMDEVGLSINFSKYESRQISRNVSSK